ncbi:MAG: DUF4214 domain-containing protein [Hyphomonadaceae bacterium]|jgi:hypothetical protein|nr:DUF4214 domain-containing protein [Hyphomonadaceae bacterium]
MGKRREGPTWACLALLFVMLTVTHSAAQEARPDLMWGVNGHPLVSYPGVTIEQQLDYIKDLGMTSYRVDVGGVGGAPGLANLVKAAKARGIQILPVIVPGLNLDKETAADLYTKAYELAFGLVSRFGGDIRVWELGNELENYAIIKPCEMQDDGVQYNCAWGPAGGVGPLEYYGPRWAKVSAVLKGLSDGTTAADPTIRKAMGTAGWGHTGAFTRMQQDGIKWDISVWHMYGQDPEWAFKILARFDRPIWITEFNNPYGSQAGLQQQALGLTLAVTRLRQLRAAYNIEAAHIYELMDETYWAPSFEAVMGLVHLQKDDKGRWTPAGPKPAYIAVKELIGDANSLPGASLPCHLNEYNRLDSRTSMQLSYVYCLILGRSADGAGYKTWIAGLDNGIPVADVVLAMLGSDEFGSRHSVSSQKDSEFVALLYRRLLNREPDGGGYASYLSQLAAGTLTRASLAKLLVNSDEFRRRHPVLALAPGG